MKWTMDPQYNVTLVFIVNLILRCIIFELAFNWYWKVWLDVIYWACCHLLLYWLRGEGVVTLDSHTPTYYQWWAGTNSTKYFMKKNKLEFSQYPVDLKGEIFLPFPCVGKKFREMMSKVILSSLIWPNSVYLCNYGMRTGPLAC